MLAVQLIRMIAPKRDSVRRASVVTRAPTVRQLLKSRPAGARSFPCGHIAASPWRRILAIFGAWHPRYQSAREVVVYRSQSVALTPNYAGGMNRGAARDLG